ncbi:MAG: hypothetical protein GY861_18315 [bacterium]|nr:hypothetical protein [bacterium]
MANPNSTNPAYDGIRVEPIELTPTNYCTSVNTIPPTCQSVFLQANVNGVTDFTVLPDLSLVPDGHVITVIAGAAASEVRSASGTDDLINNVDCGTDTAATAVLTSDETNVTNGKKVTIGTTVYQFLATPLAAYDVDIGTNAAGSMANLLAAIMGTARGTAYFKGTQPHPDVTAVATSTFVITCTAKKAGAIGNAIAKSEDDDHLDWDGAGATFTGGANAAEYLLALNQVCKFTKVSNTVGWMGLGWTPIGAIIGAITPD